MSFSPRTRLAYIPTLHATVRFSDEEVDVPAWRSPDWRSPAPTDGFGVATELTGYRADGAHGSLQAWDPVRQKQAWEVRLPALWNPGTLVTAGDLVFQGRADGELVAYHAATGEILWRQAVGLGISAPPITYSIEGRQYVALLVGWGSFFAALGGEDAAELGWQYGRHERRLVAFSLEGEKSLPALPPPEAPVPLAGADFELDHGQAEVGADVYGQCAACHGFDLVSGGLAPDLRASKLVLSSEAFSGVVRGGARRDLGMPSYEGLSDAQLDALRHYIREQARLALLPPKPGAP